MRCPSPLAGRSPAQGAPCLPRPRSDPQTREVLLTLQGGLRPPNAAVHRVLEDAEGFALLAEETVKARPEQAAKMLNLSAYTIRAYARQGLIRGHKGEMGAGETAAPFA